MYKTFDGTEMHVWIYACGSWKKNANGACDVRPSLTFHSSTLYSSTDRQHASFLFFPLTNQLGNCQLTLTGELIVLFNSSVT